MGWATSYHGRVAPRMEAEVVYNSSHSPLSKSHFSARGLGLRRSSSLAAASMASLSSSVAFAHGPTVPFDSIRFIRVVT